MSLNLTSDRGARNKTAAREFCRVEFALAVVCCAAWFHAPVTHSGRSSLRAPVPSHSPNERRAAAYVRVMTATVPPTESPTGNPDEKGITP